jgi:PLP dependent protein
MISKNLKKINSLIQKNCLISNRNFNEIKILPVTKNRSISEIKELIQLGFHEFGENKLNELELKAKELPEIKWHFIGNLQSNKAKKAVELSEVIHSINSMKLLEKIEKHASSKHKKQKIFIEVNISNEKSKQGVEIEEAKKLILKAQEMNSIELLGLMCMAPLIEPEKTRSYFKKLKLLADEFKLKELSMGMSNDYEIAVQEGATLLRIGSKIFE